MLRTATFRPFGLTLLAAATLVAGSLVAQKTPDEALAALRDGNRRFAAGKSVPQPLGEGVRRTLARGQSPFAIVLTCADSDVPPEHLFNAGLGELFVIRVAGNACDPEVLASIEYAVEHLQTPLCVVLGHEGCSAVAAANEQIRTLDLGHPTTAPSAAMQNLLERIEPAVRRAMSREYGGTELATACEVENIHLTVHESLRKSALLRRYVEAGKFRVVPARYRPGSGEVDWLSPRPMPRDRQVEALAPVQTAPANMPPHVALRLLQAGHRRFLGDGLPTGDLSAARRDTVTRGQRPLAIVLTCSDSRVPPEHVFDAGLGELVVVRVAGHALNDDALASIEHAAQQTGASLLLVMGHTRCGAVGAATEVVAATTADGHGSADHGTANPGAAAPGDVLGQLSPSMRALLDRIAPAVERARRLGAAGSELVDRAVEEHVLRTVADARVRSPLLRQLEQDGKFAILATVYDLGSGDLRWLKESEPHAEPHATPLGESAAKPPGAPHGGKHGNSAAPSGAPHGPAPQPAGGGHASQKVIDLSHDATAAQRDPHGAAGGHGAAKHAPATAPDQPHGAAAPTGTGPGDVGHGAASDHATAHGEASHAEPATAGKSGLGIDPTWLAGLVGVASLLLAAILVLMRRK